MFYADGRVWQYVYWYVEYNAVWVVCIVSFSEQSLWAEEDLLMKTQETYQQWIFFQVHL